METLQTPQQSVHATQESLQGMVEAERDTTLHELLGVDYEYAKKSGLIDVFAYDPETGRDGLLHTLVGDQTTSSKGGAVVRGFHHGPSGRALSPSHVLDDGTVVHATRSRPEDGREHPFEPYRATDVVVNGYQKMSVIGRGAERTLRPSVNTMFPDGYTPLMVMQAVRIACQNRDHRKDKLRVLGGNYDQARIATEGTVPLIDGKSNMVVKLILDFDTEKVISAMPLPAMSDEMQLTDDTMWPAILGGTIVRNRAKGETS